MAAIVRNTKFKHLLKSHRVVGGKVKTSCFYRNFSCSAISCVQKKSDAIHDVHYETSLHKKKDKTSFSQEKKELPESADVVVIGAGSVGCSTAYHLAKLDIGKIVLIEKETLTAGTTWHTAGILWNLRDGRSLTQMQIHTKELLSRILPEETGFDAGWLETGAMFVTRREEQLDALEKKSLIGSEYGVECRMIDAQEIARLHPLMDTSELIGGLYSPHDGSLDPATLCTSYIKAATKYGAEVFEHCEVKDIETEEDVLGLKRVVSVETDQGTIKTNNIVNCTGVWAPYIAQMVGLTVPQVTYKHAYVVTQGLPGMEKCPHLRDTEKALYHKRQGDALLFGGYEKDPVLVEAVEKDFVFGLYDFDWDHFEDHINSAISLVPDVAKVGIRSTVCGPESFTADGNPLMGESPQVRGFFYGSAFNSGGMMLGGGAGKQLAHWVAYGAPEIDLKVCDINRFPIPFVKNQKSWLVESCHDHFISRYDLHHTNNQPLGARNARKTPLHEVHINNGAFMSSVYGWEIPSYFLPDQKLPLLDYDYFGAYGHEQHNEYPYKDQLRRDCSFELEKDIHKQVGTETLACADSLAVVDLSHLSKYRISGPTAGKAAGVLFPSDVSSLKVNQSEEALLLTKEGKIVTNVIVSKENDGSFLFKAPAQMQQFVMRHVNQVLQDKELHCSFEDVTEKYAVLGVYGPKSLDLLKDVGLNISDEKGGLRGQIGGKEISVYRNPAITSEAFDIHCSVDDVTSVYNDLMESELKPAKAGIRAVKSLSLETGSRHLLGSSLYDACPSVTGVTTLCSVDRDNGRDYIGRPALLQKMNQPLKQKLVSFSATSDLPLFDGDVVWRDGVYVGTVEEAAFGYKSGKYVLRSFVKAQGGIPLTEEYISKGSYSVGRRSHKVAAEILR